MTEPYSSDPHLRLVRLWLFGVAAVVLAMVLVGGATRLTESGLSITEWRPLMGVLPPMNETQWQAEFAKYQAIPQYQTLNPGMSLAAFKTIFWWEWTHRLIGRLIGVVFALPFAWFLWKGWIDERLRLRLWLVFGLGALQGVVGWWMVASGLADRVEVSQYRLATHLTLACIIYVALIWTALRMNGAPAAAAPPRIRVTAVALLILVLGQIYLGALVAGLRAGYIYNTWPDIDGGLLPSGARLFFDTPWWRNFFENPLTVQFDHRMVAYAIWLVAGWTLIDTLRSPWSQGARNRALTLFIAVTLQAALGIVTLLYAAPLPLALLHQAMALAVLTAATVLAERVTRSTASVTWSAPAAAASHSA